MEMTPIENWNPEGGEVIEFVPSGESLAAASTAPVSPLRASSIQRSHIRTALDRRERGLDWSPWLAWTFHVDAPLDRPALEGAFTDFVTRHGTLLSWFEQTDANAGNSDGLARRMLEPEAVSLTTVSREAGASGPRVHELITERFRGHTSPLGWPAFVAGAVDHGSGFTVYYGVDHSHTDGVSLMLGVAEMFDLYQRRVSGTSEPLPPVGSYAEFSEAERRLESTLSLSSPEVAVWLAALSDTGGTLPTFPLHLGLEPGATAPSCRTLVDLADAETADAFERAAKAAGGGFTAGLFAALALVDAELAGRTSYVGLNAVATRTAPEYATAQGWFINLVPVTARLGTDPSFAEVVPLVQASLQRSRAATAMPARAVVDALAAAAGMGAVGETAVPPMVSYLDMRRFRGAEHPVADRIHALGGPGNTGDVSLWINRKSERTYAMASHPDTPAARAAVRRYLNAVATTIREVASA